MFGPKRILCLFDRALDHWPASCFDPFNLHPLANGDSVEIAAVVLHGTDTGNTAREGQVSIQRLDLPDVENRGLIAGLAGRMQARRVLAQTVAEYQPDCVVASGLHARLHGLTAAARLGVSQRVAVIDDMGFATSVLTLGALKLANQQATRFVATSYAGARRLVHQEAVERTRIEIIPNGVDALELERRTPESIAEAKHVMGFSTAQPLILMAAPFERKSDHRTFLEAAGFLRTVQPDARFVVLGTGDRSATDEWNRTLNECGVRERIIDDANRSHLMQWLAAADIGVLTGYGESCPPMLLTYMAAGLPLIAANAGGNPEIVRHGETGYLATIREPDQWAMYMTVLVLSQELSDRFALAARQRALIEYSGDRARRRWADLLHSVGVVALR
ncbi:MAG TPA: glycosyltransferase family 4 protein [candidate division Zixibacteria bacterium]|jgi:glycosyltransferase involved in cell wall biosynthesis